jgi:YHS domain-containing protein
MSGKSIWVTTLVVLAGLAAVPWADDTLKGDPYPLNVCPVSGEELGSMGEPIAFNHEGRDIKFCCVGCEPQFKADPAKFTAAIDAKIIEQQLPFYPLKTDVVSGEALPADANVLNVVHFNRLVRLADQKSAQKFMKDPQAYLAKLDEAVIAAQKDTYPLDTCIISGEPLDAMGEPEMRVFANRLVQFCCASCVDKFVAQPGKYWTALDGGEAPAPISSKEIHKGEHH